MVNTINTQRYMCKKDAILVAYQDSRLNVLANKHNVNRGKTYEIRFAYIRNVAHHEEVSHKLSEEYSRLKQIYRVLMLMK